MRILSITFALVTLAVSGCAPTAPAESEPLEPVLVRDLDARGDDGHFTFFSLRENRVVSPSDSATAKWDLAFRSTTILVNGGVSGPGRGGVVLLPDTAFDAVVVAPPDEAYAVDRGLESDETAIPGGAGNGWYAYDLTTMVVAPKPVVLAVRTADGEHYAKVGVLSYYLGAPALDALDPTVGFRHYTFRYLLQPDGSRQLE